MAWFNLLSKFLRLGPLGLGVIALAVLALGYYVQVDENKRVAQRAAALAAGPPAAVDIAKFDRDRDMTDVGEVVLRAQPIMDMAYRLTLTKDSGDDHVFMIPLVSAQSSNETEIVGMAYFNSPTEDFANITPELLMTGIAGFGNVAMLFDYDGRLGSMGQWDDMTADVFFDEGLTMPDNPIVVWPYPEGRAAAHAPRSADDMTLFGILSKIAGMIGLLALAKLVFRNDADAKDVEPAAQPAVFTAPEPAAAPQVKAVPLWKQRSGLVDVGDTDENKASTLDTPAFEEPATEPPVAAKARTTFSIRKVLIGVVGGLFALGLVSTVTDLMAKSATVGAAQVQPVEQVVAAGVADVIVPDADPNRHWTDIDITPIAEWFTAKFLLAVAGHVEAQLLLGGIVGGVFMGLFMLRFFFVLRRTFQPKTTARFDSMGIN